MTKAEAIEVMDGLAAGAHPEYGPDLREAAEVAVKALRRETFQELPEGCSYLDWDAVQEIFNSSFFGAMQKMDEAKKGNAIRRRKGARK